MSWSVITKNFSYKPPAKLWGYPDSLEGWSVMTADERNVDWHVRRTDALSGSKLLRLRYRYKNFGPCFLSFLGSVDQVKEKLDNESIRMTWYIIHELNVPELKLINDPDFAPWMNDPWMLVCEWSDSNVNKQLQNSEDFSYNSAENIPPVVSDFEDDYE